MTELINKLNIKYKPWKISGVKDGNKKVWAETSQTASDERVATLEKDGWNTIIVIDGKEIEQEAA
jgi:hypothetical protein